jgi:flagellar basal-body rod protein FlgC
VTLSEIMDIATSGLLAQRARLAVTASNLANAETTRTAEGGPYRRRDPVFAARPAAEPFASQLDRSLRRVEVKRISLDPRPPIPRYQPGHPDADAQGIVLFPRVNAVEEMTNMMSAARSFQANLFTVSKVRQMAEALHQIGR